MAAITTPACSAPRCRARRSSTTSSSPTGCSMAWCSSRCASPVTRRRQIFFVTLKYFPGTLGNIAAIFLLTRPKIRSTFFNQLLVVLATWDLVYILTMALEAARLSCQRTFAKFHSARRRPLPLYVVWQRHEGSLLTKPPFKYDLCGQVSQMHINPLSPAVSRHCSL